MSTPDKVVLFNRDADRFEIYTRTEGTTFVSPATRRSPEDSVEIRDHDLQLYRDQWMGYTTEEILDICNEREPEDWEI